ncbi:hypothetical protein, partial [Sediminispirochaeta bajacaliforniensis]|uniref:hypothetical protein n=1 Tax=Sediminispirochaeta bajacaliforniensis TaxID=148 RepID=UPI000475A875
MKKIWTIMLWMVLCTAPLFAFGQKEIPEGQKLEAATEGEGMPFDLYYTLEPGRVKLAWEWTEGIRYAFYVVNDEACRSVDSDRFEDVSEAAEKIYPSLSASKSTEAKSPSGIENLFVDSGSYQDGLLDTLNQSERDMLSYNKSMAEIEFLYEAASGDSFRLFLLKANGGFYEVRFDLSGGYFAGEREYITTGTGDTANKVRQLAFLSTFFGSEQNEFLNVAADSFDFTSTELTNARVQIGALENLKDLQNAFRVAFLDQLPIVEEKGSLPYFNVDEVGFEKIYGEHGAVYLKAYLAYLAKKNKPVLSRMYEKALGEESRYNYRDYEPLSDGKELAKAALRYLSWGCEYTVYLDSQFAFEPQSGNEVYKELVKDGNRDWIEAGKNGRSRATNYLPDSVGTVSLDSERLAAEHEGHEGVLKALFGYEEFTPLSGVTSLGLSADIPSFMAEGGNPLAYTPGGIDSPRTFNYKLHEQHRAMEWKLGDESFRSIPESTEAKVKRSWNLLDFGVEGRYEHYVSGEEVEEGSEYEGKEVKPFLPGYYRLGRGELEAIDGRCGVDGAGLVAGALAMTGDGVRFCGPDGEKVIENLDGYYGMSGERAGLKDGYPAYYPEEGGRIGAGGYRLRREDLEGSTVIIPELREVKAGDLLVRYEENGEVDLGIVVGVGWKEGEAQGLDNRELMEQVWVVTAKREFGMVSLGLWGNPNGRFGGFTDRPERYHVRRVLVKKEGEGSEGKRDGWELASYDLSGLKVDVSYEGERWIPNTKKRVEGKDEEEMEGIIVSRIEVKGSFEGGGSAQVLPQKRREVELLGVEDMYYEAGKGAETYGNIYNNQGSGIGLYSKEEGGEEHLIAKFERKEDGSYEVDYEGSYYGDEEGLGEEWAFLSDDEGRVWLEGRRGDGAGRIGRF